MYTIPTKTMSMSRKELLGGLALALALRLGFCLYTVPFDQKPLADPDAFEIIALNLAQKSEYSLKPGVPSALREPGYVLLMAFIYRVFGPKPWAVILILALLSTATVWMIHALFTSAFPGRGTRLVFWTAVFYPYFIYYNAYYANFREPLLSFLTALLFLLLARTKDMFGTLAAGTAAGWLCLSNFVWAPSIALLGLWVGLKERPSLKRSAVFLLPVVLILGAWGLRNWSVFGTFILGSSIGGSQIYMAASLPSEILGNEKQSAALSRDSTWTAASSLPEIEQHQTLVRASRKIIQAQPGRFLAGLLKRFLSPWKIMPRDLKYTHNTRLVRLAALLSDGWILPLSLLGLWWERKHPLAAAAGLLALSLTCTYTLTLAPIRYRVPLMPVLIVFMGLGARRLALVTACRPK